MNETDAADLGMMWQRWRTWWHEPHFMEKNSIIGCALLVVELIVMPPESPVQMLFALGWMALVALLPFAPRATSVIGVLACLAASMVPIQGWWTSGSTAMIAIFLAVGYSLPKLVAMAVPVVYSVLDAFGFALLRSESVGGSVIRGAIDALNELTKDDASSANAAAPAEIMLPQYSLIVFISTLVLNLLILGFVVAFGSAFRRSVEADARAARTERMLGRVTREQELAHMIHDSVANDMSTIAMLAWRAKATDDDDAMLDAIYARSHHALDRVHAVIDVLNGKRQLNEVEVGGVAAGADGAEGVLDIDFDTQLEKYVEDQDRTMTMLGITGVSRLNSMPDVAVSAPVRRAAMGLLEEIYANIVRHCVVSDEPNRSDEPSYNLFVDLGANHIRISEVNAITDESHTLVHGRKHGSGITLHRAAIESVGGTLNTSQQDGTWMVSAEIPLPAEPNGNSMRQGVGA